MNFSSFINFKFLALDIAGSYFKKNQDIKQILGSNYTIKWKTVLGTNNIIILDKFNKIHTGN